jgi:concentrative nucleoside transporter, CNT family
MERRLFSGVRTRMNQVASTPISWRLAIGAVVALLTTFACLNQELLGPRRQAGIGIVCFLGIAAFFSTNLRALNWRTLTAGFFLQASMAVLILKVPQVRASFEWLGSAAKQFLAFSFEGAKFVFGPLVDVPRIEEAMHLDKGAGVVFAFVVLPAVVFVSSFFSVLYHLGVLQFVVKVFAKAMRFVMGTSGAETLSVTANVVMGQTEAPLIVKPFIAGMTRSELLAMMIGGMAHISGALMAVYINMGADPVAIIATSVMAAPASLYVCKILLPETERPQTLGDVHVNVERTHANVIDAAAGGASDGMKLAINIAAMLIAFLAFIALINYLLAYGAEALNNRFHLDCPIISLQMIFSKLFSPLAVLMGVQGTDVPKMGELLGTKLALNEFIAFKKMTDSFVPGTPNGMSPHAFFLAAFALTGFANFSSIGIQLGGIGGMAENQRGNIARLGFRALLGGFLATLINASIAGILTSN